LKAVIAVRNWLVERNLKKEAAAHVLDISSPTTTLRPTSRSVNTLRTRDADLRFYITTVQDIVHTELLMMDAFDIRNM